MTTWRRSREPESTGRGTSLGSDAGATVHADEEYDQLLRSLVISPKCAPFWESGRPAFVVLAVADRVNSLGLAAGLQIVGHETYLRCRVDVDFAAPSSAPQEAPQKTLFMRRDVGSADILGISVPNPCVVPSLFVQLHQARIPIHRVDRTLYDHPFVVAGGLGVTNPAPLEPFVDAFVIGEGALNVPRLVETFVESKRKNRDKATLYERLLSIPGVYVPGAFSFEYEGHRLVRFCPDKCVDFQTIHDVPGTRRASLFMKRNRALVLADYSCRHKCSYCQMSHVRGPYSYQGTEAIKRYLAEFDSIGVREATISSASVSNLPLDALVEIFDWAKTHLGNTRPVIRSVRVDKLPLIIDLLQQERVHIAPETASDRLRTQVLRKGFTTAQVVEAMRAAAAKNIPRIRLYHLVGIPGETEEERRGFADLVALASKLFAWVQVKMYPLLPQAGAPLETSGSIGLERFREYCERFRKDVAQVAQPGAEVLIDPLHPLKHLIEGIGNTGDRRVSDILYQGFVRGNGLAGYLAACQDAAVEFQDWFRPGFHGMKPWAMIRFVR